MIAVPATARVLLAAEPVDFRRGIDGLAAIVQQHLGANPFSGDLFVFRCRRSDRVKILAWDGTGYCLYHKRLEQGGFRWPPVRDGAVRVTPAQLTMLLEGLDWSKVRPKQHVTPVLAC